jgi:hypothetical protein
VLALSNRGAPGAWRQPGREVSIVMRCFLLGVFCAVVSAVMLLASAKDKKRGAAWFWAVSFVASSLGAAYCFGKLLSDGGAA